jgi:putative membrane protein
MKEPVWHREGDDPDYRFSLANERTFLAWVRTSLALIAGSVALEELVPSFAVDVVRRILAVLVAAAALGMALVAYRRWVANETAMRHARALPYSRMPAVVAAASAIGALVVIVMVLR